MFWVAHSAGSMTMGASAPLLCDSECLVTEDMTYWERRDILGDDSYDYTDGVCDHPGDFDYDDPRDYEEWCDWNDTELVEGYYHPDHLQEDGSTGRLSARGITIIPMDKTDAVESCFDPTKFSGQGVPVTAGAPAFRPDLGLCQ